MKFGKIMVMVLMLLLFFFFAFSQGKNARKNDNENKTVVVVSNSDDPEMILSLSPELDEMLEDLDNQIEKMMTEELIETEKRLEISRDLNFIPTKNYINLLGNMSSGSQASPAFGEFEIQRDLELENYFENYFNNFDWYDFSTEFISNFGMNFD
jgi:hypothetical protein